jgi:hypothetical protein
MKIKDEKFKVEDLVKYIEESIGGETIIACARSGWRHIFNDNKNLAIKKF